MKRALQEIIKSTPIYAALRAMRQKWELEDWERCGRPVPPPHIVKQRTIREYAEKFGVKILVETGTYYGDMVDAMKCHFDRIYSIELSAELYEKARRRFAGENRVEIVHGDSGIELGRVVAGLDQPALFWLDGHYSAGVTARGDKDTPIHEELTHIFRSQQRGNVIIIDDARCFGADPAYPGMDELERFIRTNSPDVSVEVKDDSIRIVPCSQSSEWTAPG